MVFVFIFHQLINFFRKAKDKQFRFIHLYGFIVV